MRASVWCFSCSNHMQNCNFIAILHQRLHQTLDITPIASSTKTWKHAANLFLLRRLKPIFLRFSPVNWHRSFAGELYLLPFVNDLNSWITRHKFVEDNLAQLVAENKRPITRQVSLASLYQLGILDRLLIMQLCFYVHLTYCRVDKNKAESAQKYLRASSIESCSFH